MHSQKASALLAIATIIVLSTSVAYAQDSKKSKAAPQTAPEKVDISDIENKYWAPKDTDFSVVQNRTYTKEKRYSASLMYGPIINEGFVEGSNLAFTGNYFLNERYGIQVEYISPSHAKSETTKQVIAKGGSPDYGLIKSSYTVGFNWVPLYAKMSVLGKKIIYFDMAVTPVLGMTQYEPQIQTGNLNKSGITLGVDVTQWYFLNQNFALRVDLKNRWYQEDLLKYFESGGGTGQKIRTHFQDNTFLLIGGTYFF